MSQQVWLIRHGPTEWSDTGRHTGTTDIPLTEEGESAARALAPLLEGHGFAHVFVSPLGRARRTAELAGLGDRMEVIEDLREWDYGDYEGLTTEEIRAKQPGWSVWEMGAPGGEDAAAVGRRADRVVSIVHAVDRDVVLVGHGHMLRVLAARWLGQAARFGKHLSLSPATVSVLGSEHEWPAVVTWNARVPRL
jgi:broad specificity phosphatase PhoE